MNLLTVCRWQSRKEFIYRSVIDLDDCPDNITPVLVECSVSRFSTRKTMSMAASFRKSNRRFTTFFPSFPISHYVPTLRFANRLISSSHPCTTVIGHPRISCVKRQAIQLPGEQLRNCSARRLKIPLRQTVALEDYQCNVEAWQ